MKNVTAFGVKSITILLLFIFSWPTSTAQETSHDLFMEITKLKKANDDFMDVETEMVKPYMEERIKRGNLVAHALFRVMYPASDDAEYDYIALDIYDKFEHIHMERETMMEIAGAAFPSADLPKMMERFEASSHHASSDIFVWEDEAFPGPEGGTDTPPRFIQVNAMKVAEGNASRYVQMESEVFKPVHQARAKAGNMHDWILLQRMMPYGTDYDDNFLTFDIYSEWGDIANGNMAELFANVHPGKDMEEIFGKMSTIRELKRSEMWELVSFVNTSTPEVVYEIVNQGSGDLASKGQEISWSGKLTDTEGNEFFNTKALGYDFQHVVGSDPYDRFFDKGIRQMKPGGMIKIHVPAEIQGEDLTSMTNMKDAIMEITVISIQDQKKDGTTKLREVIVEKGLEEGKKMYMTAVADSSNDMVFRESSMNALGYQLMNDGHTEAAIYIFKLNHNNNPTSWNACDSLGDGYAATGNTTKAKAMYEKALKINPDFKASRDKLAKMD